MITTLSGLKLLTLGLWLGALVMLGYAVAGPIFQQAPSKTLAGQMNGIILGRMNTLEWVFGSAAFVCTLVLLALRWSAPLRTLRLVEVGVLLVTMIVLWIYASRITSRMNELRATIQDFDHPRATAEYSGAKNEFDTLHHTYTKLVSTNMFLILGEFVLGVYVLRKG